jgi:uncharacterized protein (TIGR03083 family)
MADLAWHLTEVQYFWASIVSDLLESPEHVVDLERPDDAALPALFDEQTARLVSALRDRDPEDRCWSWYDGGFSVGWVERRQAHEALIHRVDAELGADERTDVDSTLGADGVDEVLTTMIDCADIPDWASFDADGTTAVLEADTGQTWSMALGRFTGTSPDSGTNYDDPALMLQPDPGNPEVTIRGSGSALDLWLWGRGSLDDLQVDGSRKAAEMIRAAAVAGTQ